MSAEALALIDTNILVYAYDESEPERQAIAESLIGHLVDEDRLCLSTQIFKEFYVTMTRKIASPLSPSETLAIMDDLSLWPCVEIDYSIIREAVLISTETVISFWDALILAAAKRGGADRLYTEDLNHGQRIYGVEVVNPFHEVS